jgi:hypothetical protein
MKKVLLFLILAGIFSACYKDFDELNTDIKNPSSVPPVMLFTGAQRQMADAITNTNVNINIFRLLSQYWTETTYIDESNYDLGTRSIPQNFWNIVYVDVLNPLKKAGELIPDQAGVLPEVLKNQSASVEIMTVYAYSVLVNTYGDIPYSEAMDINNVHPAYDDDAAIVNDLIARLDAAIGNIDAGADGFGGGDVLFGGDMGRWVTFANSLKLRLGMLIADADSGKAAAAVESGAAGAVGSNGDNIVFAYESSAPNTNPVWVDLIQSGRQDFVAANTLVDKMVGLGDPRVPYYFTTDAGGGYSGGIYGSNNNFATYSKPNDALQAPDYGSILFDYAETEFLLAEAVERGMNVGGTAAEHYANAIRASIENWGGSSADADAYLALPAVAYATAEGDWKQKIGTQKWIALYNRGFDAWTEWRRLDHPVLVAPIEAVTDIPVRYTYPVQEQNLNAASWEAASSAIGGDAVTTKLFWDKF